MSKSKPEAKGGTDRHEEAPVLPGFPIRWTPIGVCVETLEDNLNHQNMVQLVNQITLPRLNLVTINTQDLVEQEIHASTELGLRLKSAKQDSNEKKKKEVDQQKWMPPSALILEALNARMLMDRDFEHKKESAKRKKDLEDARSAVEVANAELKKVQDDFLYAESSLKLFRHVSAKAREEEEKPKEFSTPKKRNSLPSPSKHEKEKMVGAISGKCRQGMPDMSLLSREEKGTLESKIQNDSQYSLSLVQVHRKLKKLKDALSIDSCNNTSEVLQLEECLQCLRHSQYMELFPDNFISEVYSKAKLDRPFERLIYDEIEDCMLSVLYATDGEYEWRHSIPYQIPFGDFCDKHQDLRSFTVAPRSYKLEEHRSQVIDKKYFHLLVGGGLFSCGLPSVYENVREPQGTLHMDGNTFNLRSIKRESKMDIELTACFEDGLTACFFSTGNGSISLQLSNPNATTIDMDSTGFIYMCSTYMGCQSRRQFEKMDPKQTDSKNSKSNLRDPSARKMAQEDCWRCVLPSGTVLCGKQNGDLVVGTSTELKCKNTNKRGFALVRAIHLCRTL